MAWLKKDEQVADALRALIASGEWVGELPGYRKLEQRLKVSRPTIEKALERLTTEGWLGPAEAGKRRTIVTDRPVTQPTERRILLVVGPRPMLQCSSVPREILFEVLLRAEEERWTVIYEHFDFGFRRKAVSQIERLAAEHRPTKLLMMFPNDALVEWASQAEIPCFSVTEEVDAEWAGGNGVSVPYSELVCAAAQHLRAQGHQRILVPILSGKTLVRKNVIEASAATWAKDYSASDLEVMFPEQGDWLPDVMKGFWRKPFAVLKPTAVIVKGTNEFLSLLSFCTHAGIQIPHDLSVIQLASDPICTWLDPVPDRFEFPVDKICRKALNWLEQPNPKVRGFETVEATYQRGGTVSAAR